MANGQTIHLWDFYGHGSQKWIIEHHGNGYYAFRTAYTTDPYYLTWSGDSTSGTNYPVVLNYFSSVNDVLLWRIFPNSDGTFHFIPKGGEEMMYCLAAETNSTNNGVRLMQSLLYSGQDFEKWAMWDIGELQSQEIGIVTVAGKTLLDYTIPINKFLKNSVELCGNHRCMSWVQYCEWGTNISPVYPLELSEYEGMRLASFIWFFEQVRSNAIWDVKIKASWELSFLGVPYPGYGKEFIFRGKQLTPEGLGNLMYGYNGRATGFGDVTLYWGGGVAKLKSVTKPELEEPPYYGDDENDHVNIEAGYNMFLEDYPDYPEPGCNEIPRETNILKALLRLFENDSEEEKPQ